ncbi:MAG: YkgJ family cysteine cluster protein [Deltaproteobacteria bacterium]|nr:YkgJ family cysteine cluster protein [Deltaproteobacteria bacterium]
MPPVRTLGQLLEDEHLLTWIRDAVGGLHAYAAAGAEKQGKRLAMAVTCTGCTAKKTCCHSKVVARLYEGILVASDLVDAGRDTPELREQLRAAAEAMETTPPRDWRRPCVFLDERERCTVYAVRPVPCGAVLVYTNPTLCTTRAAPIKAYIPNEEYAAATAFEEQFRERFALRKKVGRRYLGVLPRMVLVALEAWHRTDFRDYLRQLSWPSDEDIEQQRA